MASKLHGIARRRLPATERVRLEEVRIADAGHGFDPFGLNIDGVALGLTVTRFLYERWFRVESRGIEHVPRAGGAILAANHSGTLPFDAAMIWADVARRTDPPRVVRPVMDHFVGELPIVGTLFSRVGGVGGSRGNTRALLEAGELLLVFPEGTVGIGKPFRARYRLQEWRVGHAELAIRHGVPIVPVAVVGAEEQLPELVRLPLRLFGAPYLPIPATPLPLPVHYHISYGEPIRVAERWEAARADDPAVASDAARVVKDAVQALLDEGVRARKGVFS